MSHSYRHQHHYSFTCSGFNGSLKKDKRINNQRLRTVTRHRLRTAVDYEDLVLPERLEEVMERWDYIDDGRYYMPLWYILSNMDKPYQYLKK